jgi:hypothetical protein
LVEALTAGFWGFVGGASLLVGLYAGASQRVISVVVAVGAVVVASALASLFGYLFLAGASGETIAVIQSFAAGAILHPSVDTMEPKERLYVVPVFLENSKVMRCQKC